MTRSEVRVLSAPPYYAKGYVRQAITIRGPVLRSFSEEGAIAQLARAPALQAGGPGFESPLLHQSKESTARWAFYFGGTE